MYQPHPFKSLVPFNFCFMLLKLKNICLVFICVFVCACDNDNENIVMIGFSNIVGNYNGISNICAIDTIAQDTACTTSINNIVRIIVIDNVSVLLDDTEKIYNQTVLELKSSEMVNGQMTYYFETDEIETVKKLTYLNSNKSILYDEITMDNGQAFTNRFRGKR